MVSTGPYGASSIGVVPSRTAFTWGVTFNGVVIAQGNAPTRDAGYEQAVEVAQHTVNTLTALLAAGAPEHPLSGAGTPP